MKLNSCNEWDTLKTVILGTVDGFSPCLEIADLSGHESLECASVIAKKAFPKWYLDEVKEDLEGLSSIFKKAGVTVLRPNWSERSSLFQTPNWRASGFDIYNVRDNHIVFGNTLVVGASSSRSRQFESLAFQDIFYNYFFEEGFKWVCAPTPKLKGEYVHEIKREKSKLEETEEELHKSLSHGLSEIFHCLDEDEVIFDAANIIRLGKDVLFLVSSTGNRKAVKWLTNVLGVDVKVHETHTYRSSHLDSTILPLCEGVVLLNGARVSEETCPQVLKNWEKIFFTDVAPVPSSETEFHQTVRMPVYKQLLNMGVHSHLNHISSPWAGMNVMSLDEKTVLVHDQQYKMIKMLESKKFTVVPVQMRHCYTMLGGLHCTTLDVVRDS